MSLVEGTCVQNARSKWTVHQNIVNHPPNLGTVNVVELGALMWETHVRDGKVITGVNVKQPFAFLIALVWTVTSNYCLPPLIATANSCVEVTHNNDHVPHWNGCKSRLKLLVECI